MKNLWDDSYADSLLGDILALRVYSSRLIGRNPNLVLHGGGNTSVKAPFLDLFGESHEAIFVKGSGWDLATIEVAGFAPVKIEALRRLAELETLTDRDMVQAQRVAMLDQNAPNPSVEAILHAIIPFTFVDHTHADAVVTLTNTHDGRAIIEALYGDRVLIVPYVMPGFDLAKRIFELTRDIDWSRLDGIVLMQHGIFSFSDDAKSSYSRMIKLVTEAEQVIKPRPQVAGVGQIDALSLSEIRFATSRAAGRPVLMKFNGSSEHLAFASAPNINSISCRGPLTPDHVIRTKRVPAIIDKEPLAVIEEYVRNYDDYFNRLNDGHLTQLDPAPRWLIWPGRGTICVGSSDNEVQIVSDIVDHTIQAITDAERLGGWTALPEKDIFAVEYWELEQAKLGRESDRSPLNGCIALVTGAASGIGRACVERLAADGAHVLALDRDPTVQDMFLNLSVTTFVCDLTNSADVETTLESATRIFGGLDILVNNAGIFTSTMLIEEMDYAKWQSSLDTNLTAAMQVMKLSIPFLRNGWNPTMVIIGSKNVPAPGSGASAYSVAKAGLTQLSRLAAIELGRYRIRVNTVHPNAVFDTAIWTDEVLAERALQYNLSIEEYRSSNILGVEITSTDVAEMVCAMVGPAFMRTTGAQVPVDGGVKGVV
ncbi:MAG: bifunctional aldolase/short-chain dehydrogenase [Acidiferrobacteraceae bacterium]|nr:bifunctional aldolase/short-chain dehydrogenase [Acidiferrobacteraceae bacterium]